MPIQYKDYYEIMGLPRTATQDELRKTYHKLARKYHPDVNKSKDAEARFKEIAEAYEVLGDPGKRKRYDELGSVWHSGQEFRPPPGWENVHFEFHGQPGGRGGPRGFSTEDMGGFSDFFESLFGGGGMGGGGMHFEEEDFGGGRHQRRGEDHEAEVAISVEEADRGGKKSIALQATERDGRGRVQRHTKTYEVRIPAGVTDGARIRLAGQGGEGVGGAGDLYLRVRLAPHDVFKVDGHDVEVVARVAPWTAALGGKVTIPTLGGRASLAIPAGTQSGQRVRLRGKGLGGKGDLYAVVQIAVPKRLTSKERELFEQLARASSFDPES
jgi:curved DNA-binding protein